MYDWSRSGRRSKIRAAAPAVRRPLIGLLALMGLLGASCASLQYPGPPNASAEVATSAGGDASESATAGEPSANPSPAEPTAVPAPGDGPGWTELSRQGRDAVRVGDYALAEERWVAALRAIDALPSGDARVQTSLRNLLTLTRHLQRVADYEASGRVIDLLVAESQRGRALDVDALSAALLDQGQHLQSQGQAEAALLLYEKASSLPRPAGAASTQPLALSQSLASAYVELGRFDEALPLLVEIAEGLEAREGADSLALAAALGDLARLRSARGQHHEAEQAYRRVLEIQSASRPGSVEVAVTTNALASVLLDEGRNLEALTLAREAVAALEALQIDGAALSAALDTLATAEARTERYLDAEEHYRLAITERDKASPAVKLDLVVILENYASMLRELDRNSEAEALEARVDLELKDCCR